MELNVIVRKCDRSTKAFELVHCVLFGPSPAPRKDLLSRQMEKRSSLKVSFSSSTSPSHPSPSLSASSAALRCAVPTIRYVDDSFCLIVITVSDLRMLCPCRDARLPTKIVFRRTTKAQPIPYSPKSPQPSSTPRVADRILSALPFRAAS